MDLLGLSYYPIGVPLVLTIFWAINVAGLMLLIVAVELQEATGYAEVVRGERHNLLQAHQLESSASLVQQPWRGILMNNIENMVPFFLVSYTISVLGFATLDVTSHGGVYYTFYVLVGMFVVTRFLHFVFFMWDKEMLRGGAYTVGAFINILLAFFGIGICAAGQSAGLILFPKAVTVTVSVVVAAIVLKLYYLDFTTNWARYSNQEETLSKLVNMTRNTLETVVPVIGVLPLWIESLLVLPDHMGGVQVTGIVTLLVFIICRLMHTLFYFWGRKTLVSMNYHLGVLATLVLGWTAVGAIIHANTSPDGEMLTFAVAIPVLIMVDLMRTWIVAFSIWVIEKRADAIIPEDTVPMGASQPASVQANILMDVQVKDVQLQLAFFFILHLLGGTLLKKEETAALVIACLFVFSRLLYTLLAVLRFPGVNAGLSPWIAMISWLLVLVLWFINFIARIRFVRT